LFSSHFERTYELYTRRDSPADVFSPEVLDDYVSPENPVRVVDAYVGDFSMANLDFPLHAPKRPDIRLIIRGILVWVSELDPKQPAWWDIELMGLIRKLHPDYNPNDSHSQ